MHAMSRSGILPKCLGYTSPTHKTPTVALLVPRDLLFFVASLLVRLRSLLLLRCRLCLSLFVSLRLLCAHDVSADTHCAAETYPIQPRCLSLHGRRARPPPFARVSSAGSRWTAPGT
jgi:hypothetical protein